MESVRQAGRALSDANNCGLRPSQLEFAVLPLPSILHGGLARRAHLSVVVV